MLFNCKLHIYVDPKIIRASYSYYVASFADMLILGTHLCNGIDFIRNKVGRLNLGFHLEEYTRILFVLKNKFKLKRN